MRFPQCTCTLRNQIRLLLICIQDHVLYESFNGVVLAEEEGKNIAQCLGSKKAALLQNHGLLTVGETVEAAVFWFVSMDKCCHAQLLGKSTISDTFQDLI